MTMRLSGTSTGPTKTMRRPKLLNSIWSLWESLYDELVTRRTVDDDGGGYSLVPQTELEVELGDESHRVQTRDEALELIKEYYNEHGLLASGGS